MPGKHNAGGCACCCPVVTCTRASSTSISYSVSGSENTYLVTICGYTETLTEITPANGSGTITVDANCIYFIRAIGANGCEVQSFCSGGSICRCKNDEDYLVIEVDDDSTYLPSTSGTYYTQITTSGGVCFWGISGQNMASSSPPPTGFFSWSFGIESVSGGFGLVFRFLYYSPIGLIGPGRSVLLTPGPFGCASVFDCTFTVNVSYFDNSGNLVGGTMTFTTRCLNR